MVLIKNSNFWNIGGQSGVFDVSGSAGQSKSVSSGSSAMSGSSNTTVDESMYITHVEFRLRQINSAFLILK